MCQLGQGYGRLMPGCGWWGPWVWGHQELHELRGPPVDSVNTKCQVLSLNTHSCTEGSYLSFLAWGDETCRMGVLSPGVGAGLGMWTAGRGRARPFRSAHLSLSQAWSVPEAVAPTLPCPPGPSPAGTCFIAMSSFPSLCWCWGGGRGAGRLGAGWLCPACPRHQERPGEHFRILTQVEEVCPAPGGGRSLSRPRAGWCSPARPSGLGSSQGLRPLQGRGACSPALPRLGFQTNQGLAMGVSPGPHCPRVSGG